MKVTGQGKAIRDVLIRLKIEPDKGNAQRMRDFAKGIKDVEDSIHKETRERQQQERKEREGTAKFRKSLLTEQEEADARYWMARMSREKQYRAEQEKNARDQQRRDKQTEREKLAEGARIARQIDKDLAQQEKRRKQEEREQLRMGARLAKEYDNRIREQERREQEFHRAAQRRHEQRDRMSFEQGKRVVGGGLNFARGAAELFAANALPGTGGNAEQLATLAKRITEIHGTYRAVGGLLDVVGGVRNTKIGHRYETLAVRQANRFGRSILHGADALSSKLGLSGSGAVASSSAGGAAIVGGATLAAIAGLTAALVSARDTWKAYSDYGFRGGAKPGTFADTIARGEVGAVAGVANFAGVRPSAAMRAAHFVPGLNSVSLAMEAGGAGAAMDEMAKSQAKTDRMQKALQSSVATRAEHASGLISHDRSEAGRLQRENSLREMELNARLESGRANKSDNAANLNDQVEVTRELARVRAQIASTEKADLEQVHELKSREYALLERQNALVKEGGRIAVDAAKSQLESIRQAEAHQKELAKAAREGLKSKEAAFGAMDPLQRAKTVAAYQHFEKEGVGKLTQEQRNLLATTVYEKYRRASEGYYVDVAKKEGGSLFAEERKSIAEANKEARRLSVESKATVNLIVNAEKSARDVAAEVERQVQRVFKELYENNNQRIEREEELANNQASVDAYKRN